MTYIRIAGVMALGAFTAIAIVVLSMATTLAMFGIVLYALSGPATASTGPTVATAEMPCAAGIVDILKRSAGTMPYRMVTTVTSGEYSAELTTDVVPRFGMSTAGTANGVETALVVFRDHGWMMVEGEWRSASPDLANDLMADLDPFTISMYGEPTEARCLGLVTVDGEEYLRFVYVYKSGGAESRGEMLVDPETLLAVRLETILIERGVVLETAIVTYIYDATITIVPPANVPIL